ncbi:G2 and S phase-expressed protein 1 isoform X2 [Hemicordylus capensis]|nr:G2 and S phase-expressed protein 1 isoform X2 [Hemicordylus capensis]XP_053113945.1 G2 and S phase-expressed protein 1 isoform X2 [Hemicordylus capensis]XP_053113946.1 G2 and S phase-expressed protein 1 isoform X2 [Hemicordylus capensis]
MEEGQILPSECKLVEIKPNDNVNNDCPFLTDEKFDFDLSLSPSSDHEDEVFVGPMGHKEKCIAVSLEAHEGSEDKILPAPGDKLTWSPLAGEKYVEIFKEAHLVAIQLQSGSKPKRNAGKQEEQKAEVSDTFVQDSKLKQKIFENGIEIEKTPRMVKRETYCVWESPLCQMAPSFQKYSRQPVTEIDNSHSPQMPVNTPSPGMNTLTKIAFTPLTQGHSHKNNKKTSTLQTIKTSAASGHSNYFALEQSKQGKPRSFSSKNHLNSLGSSEDLLSDKSSIAPDVGDLSFCNSSVVQDKRTLPTPSKLGIKTTQLKPPSSVPIRRNTSSSSSSLSSLNSSFNSSLSTSPNRGNVKMIVGAKASLKNSRLSLSTSKISVVRPMSVSSMQSSHFDASGKQQQSTSAIKRNPSMNVPKYKASLTYESSSSGIRRENSESNLQKLSQRFVFGNIRTNSCSKPNTKTVLTRPTKEERDSEKAAAKILQPIKLLSYGNIESNVAGSPPVKPSEDRTLSNSCSVAKSALRTPASAKHSSLPTPIGRRMSGIPTMTPKTVPRLTSSPNLIPVRHVSSVSSKKTLAPSSKWAKNKAQLTSSSSSEGDLSPPQVVSIALDFSPEKASVEMVQDLAEIKKPAEEMQAKEGLLIDTKINKTPIPIQECENKPLIDLFNTPEIIKAPLMKPTEQLIDLSSPLIGLSPEGNKENLHSPLLKF